MLWWILLLLILVILSYLSQLAFYLEMQIRYPYIVATIINIMILGCIVGVVVRILKRMRKKEKETLITKLTELEEKLKAKKEENSS